MLPPLMTENWSSTAIFLVFIVGSISFLRINSNSALDSMNMATHLSFNLTTLSFLCLFGLAMAKPAPCTGKYPVEEAVIGKEGYAPGWCSTGGMQFATTMKIHKWGLTVAPLSEHQECKENIIVLYTKSNRAAMIYHRPFAGPKFFKKSHPALYKKHKSGGYVRWPCDKVPLRRVYVWKNRAKFVSLLKEALSNVKSMRDIDCGSPDNYGSYKDRYTWKQLRRKIAEDRVITAAVNFLHGVAYRNFFCV